MANAILYLCDGNVDSCRKTACYKNGGECRHTVHRENSKTGIVLSDKTLNRFDVKKHQTIKGLIIFVEKDGPYADNK